MWAEACEMLDRAERMQRQFFRFGPSQAQARWEPPVDIVAYGADVQVTVALPGVAPERIEVRTDSGVLLIAALRPPPMQSHMTAVHRLEIPYGRFERRIALPAGHYELMEQAYVNGCLVLRLAKR